MASVTHCYSGYVPYDVAPARPQDEPASMKSGTSSEEQLLESLHAMEQADHDKNRFLAALSHELRNPLTPIRNSVHILRRASGGGDQAKRALSIIERQVDHMARLIDELLDVARIAEGKVTLRRETVDLRALLSDAIEDHAAVFAQRGVELTLVPCDELTILGDRTRLAQVLTNLLQNAAKFTPRGGRSLVHLSHSGRTGEAVIRVRDTGVGIEADMLAHVFEPFVQVHAEEHSHPGLGLGLAVVKGLVEMHGGSVLVSSQGKGRGSEFTIRLPAVG